MDWFNIQLNLRDKRILLLDIQNDSGLVYTYPQNSFNIDNFLESENNYNNLLISSTNTPNTFITYLDDAFSFRNLKCLSTGGLGLSPQFVYYESTVWLLKRKQKEQIPFFYSLQLLSVFVNVRWVLIQKQEKISINSVSEFFPSAVWPERELQDMFSISFDNLKDTRRLLLDYKLSRGVLSPKYTPRGLSLFSPFYDVYYA